MSRTYRFVTAALFAALVFIATLFFTVKLPNGYANLGDCFIIAAACLLGYKYGACAGAIGASLADLVLGYAIYAPATFVIKALMAVAAAVIFTYLKKRAAILGVVLGALAAEVIMAGGYFLFESIMYGVGGAVLSVAGNAMQGIVNLVAAIILMTVFTKSKYIREYFSKLNKN